MGQTAEQLRIVEVKWEDTDNEDALIRRVMALLLRPPSLMDVESVAEVETAESSVVHGDLDALPDR